MEEKRRQAASSTKYSTIMTTTQTTNSSNKIQVIGMFVRILKAAVIARIKTLEEEVAAAEVTTNTRTSSTTISSPEVAVDLYRTQTTRNKKGSPRGVTIPTRITWVLKWTLTLRVQATVVNNKKITLNTHKITKNTTLSPLLQTIASGFKITKNDTLVSNTTTWANRASMLNQVTVAVSPTTITIWYTNKMDTNPDIKAIIRTIRADPNTTNNVGDEGITFVSRSNKPDTNKKTTTIMERKKG